MKKMTLGRIMMASPWTNTGKMPTEADVLSDPIWNATLRATKSRPETLAARPDESGCLVWQGAENGNGHAMYHEPAYRHYWSYFYGPIPEGFQVHHVCGNGRCVNPLHLRAVTPEQHRELAKIDGAKRGAKLTREMVAAIKRMAHQGLAHREIANNFGISISYVSLLKLNLRWLEVDPAY